MKIAIITVYDSIVNFGSFLQAFALKSTLEQMGHSVSLVKRMENQQIEQRFNKIAWNNLSVPKNKKYRGLRQIRRVLLYKRECKANKRRMKESLNDWKKLNIISRDQITNVDLIICGSDEIWNIHNKDIDINFYTCDWCGNIPRIAYAISSGDTISSEIPQAVYNSIRAFKGIMPRDENTQKLVLDITGGKNEVVCDPTILYGKENYKLKNYSLVSKKYLLVYSYVYTKQQKEHLKKYAKEKGLKIISACIACDFADETIYCSALDFPSLLAQAECVFTATFHGTIFGLMFAKKLCCVPRLDKVKSLLKLCDALDYGINENCNYEIIASRLDCNVDHTRIDAAMNKMKKKSCKILEDNLSRIAYGRK